MGGVARALSVATLLSFSMGCPERPMDSLPPEVPSSSGGAAGASDAGATSESDDAGAGAGDYEWVVKRPHVTVALAEARGIDKERAKRGVEGLADAFEGCLRRRAAERKRDDGAARLVVAIDDQGNVSGVNLRVDGEASGPVALLCFVANAKAQNYGRPVRSEAGVDEGRAPGLALEALWKSGEAEKFTP